MDTERLVEVLEWALGQGVQPFVPEFNLDPNSFQAELLANNLVQTEEPTRDAVVQVLAGEPELRVFGGGVICTRGGLASRSELTGLCDWLLAQTLLHGSSSAVRRLQEFVEGEHRTVLEVLALSGITVEGRIELPRGVALVPFSSLPRSEMSDSLAPDPMRASGHPMRLALLPDTSAALVIERDDGVEILENFPDPADGSAHASDQMLLHRIAQCLTLLGPSCPTEVAQWTQLRSPERVPILGVAQGFGAPIQEAYPQTTTTLDNHEEARELVERYLDLEEGLQNKIAVPIRRLNFCIRRLDPADKAIESGIALEALLTADRASDAPLSYLLRVRVAWLGGGSLKNAKTTRTC